MRIHMANENVMFLIERRGGDHGGPSLHLLVRTPKRPPTQETSRFQQIWRADCFREAPHEHLFGPDREVIRDLPDTDIGHPVEWCLNQCGTRLPDIVREAGYPEIAEQEWFFPLTPTDIWSLHKLLREV